MWAPYICQVWFSGLSHRLLLSLNCCFPLSALISHPAVLAPSARPFRPVLTSCQNSSIWPQSVPHRRRVFTCPVIGVAKLCCMGSRCVEGEVSHHFPPRKRFSSRFYKNETVWGYFGLFGQQLCLGRMESKGLEKNVIQNCFSWDIQAAAHRCRPRTVPTKHPDHTCSQSQRGKCSLPRELQVRERREGVRIDSWCFQSWINVKET